MNHHDWEMEMIRTRGWIYIKPRKPALWRRIVRALTDWLSANGTAEPRNG